MPPPDSEALAAAASGAGAFSSPGRARYTMSYSMAISMGQVYRCREPYVIEFRPVEAMTWLRDWKKLDGDAQIVEILCSNGSRIFEKLVCSVWIVVVRNEE
jgi:hypothetical protein